MSTPNNKENWEERFDSLEGKEIKAYSKEDWIKIKSFIKNFLLQDRALREKEMVEKLEIFLHSNDITDKKSFVALRDFITSLNK